MAPKKRKPISQRSDQYLDIKSSNLLQSLGEADLGELSGIDPKVRKAYKLRRLKLAELEVKLKNLLNTSKLTTEIKEQVGDLAREIKAVVLTDPTETFKFDPKSRTRLNIGGTRWKGWVQTTNKWYKEGKPKNFEAHHKGGLEATFKGILGYSDSKLIDLHKYLATKGKALGNNPLNRIFLRKGSHQSRPRTGGPESQAVHPLLDLTEPDSDDFMKLLDKTIDQRVTTDWGLPEGRKIFPPLPDPGEFGWDADQYKALLAHEYSIADSIPSQIGPEDLYWTRDTAKKIGPTKSKILKTFVNRYPDPNTWPEGTRDLLKAGDAEGIMRLTDKIELDKQKTFNLKLAEAFGTGTNTRNKIMSRSGEIIENLYKKPIVKAAGIGLTNVGKTLAKPLGLIDPVAGAFNIHDAFHPDSQVAQRLMSSIRATENIAGTAAWFKPAALKVALPIAGATAIAESQDTTKLRDLDVVQGDHTLFGGTGLSGFGGGKNPFEK
mgnify:CR=1 FL=1